MQTMVLNVNAFVDGIPLVQGVDSVSWPLTSVVDAYLPSAREMSSSLYTGEIRQASVDNRVPKSAVMKNSASATAANCIVDEVDNSSAIAREQMPSSG